MLKLTIGLFFLFPNLAYSRPTVEIESPFWWAGMENPELQSMLYGYNNADLHTGIEYDTNQLKRTVRVNNR